MTRFKDILIVTAVTILLPGCSKNPDDVIIIDDEDPVDWVDCAEKAFRSLKNLYLDEERGIFFSTNYHNTSLNYWWQAHGLNAIVDASLRVNDDRYDDLITDFYNGIDQANNGFTNDFYDDMSWMGIALTRSYLITDDARYLVTAKLLWEDIITGWNENHGGGISWNKQMLYYKNTPSNATAAILSFRLYEITGESRYLAMGESIINWLHLTLVDKTTGLVWDGIGREGGDQIDYGWLFTYNQGIYIGACILYYNIVQEEVWLERAIRTADNALADFKGKYDVLKDEGEGDGGLFKGILIRYLKLLSDQEYLNEGKYSDYSGFIKENAERLWEYGKSTEFPYLFNHDWTESPSGSVDLSVQLSGVFLLEACAALRDAE
jgi:predicted alpha-1,6-mannanase (GH76 family)